MMNFVLKWLWHITQWSIECLTFQLFWQTHPQAILNEWWYLNLIPIYDYWLIKNSIRHFLYLYPGGNWQILLILHSDTYFKLILHCLSLIKLIRLIVSRRIPVQHKWIVLVGNNVSFIDVKYTFYENQIKSLRWYKYSEVKEMKIFIAFFTYNSKWLVSRFMSKKKVAQLKCQFNCKLLSNA